MTDTDLARLKALAETLIRDAKQLRCENVSIHIAEDLEQAADALPALLARIERGEGELREAHEENEILREAEARWIARLSILRMHSGDAGKMMLADFATWFEKRWTELLSAEQSLSSARADAVRVVKDRIDLRMNNHLIEMREGYDDSITGFNEAWDVVRSVLADLGGDDAKRG